MAHPLFRQAVKGGRWYLTTAGRINVAHYLLDLAHIGASSEVLEVRRAHYGSVKNFWCFHIVGNCYSNDAEPGDLQRGKLYTFEFDAATTRLLDARQQEQ